MNKIQSIIISETVKFIESLSSKIVADITASLLTESKPKRSVVIYK